MRIEAGQAMKRNAGMLVVALAGFLLQATLAFGHASLNAASPPDGAVIERAPGKFTLTFNEPVSPLVLKLIRADGSAISLDTFETVGPTVEIDAPSDLGLGTHVLSWRVVSADGHPVGGSVVFSIGEVSSAATEIEQRSDWTTRIGIWLTRVLLYTGLFFGAGGLFARKVLMPGLRSGDTFIVVVLVLSLVGTLLSVGFQGLDALGEPVDRIADASVWSAGFGTSYSNTVLFSAASILLGIISMRVSGSAGKVTATAVLLLAAIALASSGHASAADPQWLTRSAVFLHALAIAIWLGALAPLALALRRREAAALSGLARFSTVIPWMLIALIAGGMVLSVVQIQKPVALFDTTYGQIFIVKLALFAGLLALAAYNRWRLTDAVSKGDKVATRNLVHTIAAETLIVLLVFGAAATWRFTPPPRALASTTFELGTTQIHSDKAMANLTVSPGQTGTVTVSAFLMTGDHQPLDAKQVVFVFSNPTLGIEPFERLAERADDGSWRVRGVVLPQADSWVMQIDILISDFEVERIESEIRIRP